MWIKYFWELDLRSIEFQWWNHLATLPFWWTILNTHPKTRLVTTKSTKHSVYTVYMHIIVSIYLHIFYICIYIYIRNHIHMWMWYFFSTFALKTTRFQFVASYPPCQFQANESRQGTRPRGKVWLHRQVVLWALKQERCKVPDRWLPNPSSAIFEKSENPGWKGLWKNTCFLFLLNGFSITY